MADTCPGEMNLYNSPLCRLCCEINKNGVNLKSKDTDGRYLLTLINQYLPIKVEDDGKLPQTICPGCHIQIQGIVEFYELLFAGQKKLETLWADQEEKSTSPDGFLIPAIATKRKRGRPKKALRPSPETGTVEGTEPAQSKGSSQNDDDQNPIEGKRRRRTSNRYQGEVQGKELDKVLTEEGVLEDEELLKIEKDRTLSSKLDDQVDQEKEIIGHIETVEGADLGEVSILNKPEKFAQRYFIEFKCDTCNERFKQESKFLEHQACHELMKQSNCTSKCDKPSVGSEEQSISQPLVGDTEKDVTDQEFLNGKFSVPKESSSGNLDSKQIKCPLCKKIFRYNNGLKLHMKQAHKNYEDLGFPCDICSKSFRHPSSVTYHKETEHNNTRKYICIKCNKVFKHRQLLRRHQLVHTENRPHKCKVCDATFKSSSYLSYHLLMHRGEKKYTCSICNQNFTHKTSLKIHQRWHTGQKPFQCDICKKSFSQKGNLQEHVRIHTGEKPYECEYCLRRFTTSSQYRVHVKSHKGEKPWKCEHCGKAFLYKDTWKTHLRRHNGEKPYMCTVCNRDFSEVWSLKKHLRLHTGEKPYKCSVCDKAFADYSNMVKHRKTHLTFEDQQLEENSPAVDLWTVFKPDEEIDSREKESNDLQQIFYITYSDPENPATKISEKYLMDKEDMVAIKEMDDSEGNQVNEMMHVMDEQGNPLRFTTQDGTMVQVTTVDGESLQLTLSDGNTIPVQITTANGENISPEIRTVDCLPIIASDVDETDQNVEGLEFVTDHQDVRLLAGLSEASLDFLPLA